MPFARHIPCKPIEKGQFGFVQAPAAGGGVNANDVPPPTRSGFAELWRKLSASGSLLYRAALAWNRDNGMRLSAAVALYTILALSPLLVITIKVVSLVLGEEMAAGLLQRQAESLLGPVGAQSVEGMIANSTRPGSGLVMTLFSLALLLFTASGVFNELRDGLNAVWNIVPVTGRGIWATIRDRLPSVGMVFVLGFLLVVSHVLTVTLTVMSEHVLGKAGWIMVAVDLAVSTVVLAALFGVLFRVLPDARLAWRDVLFGSVVTAVLFKIGQYLQALYFTYGTTASAYGAAGSLVIVLLWVYYSCWVLFFGAELIQERVRMLGRQVPPSRDAVHAPGPCSDPDRKEQQWLGKEPEGKIDTGR